MTKPGSVRTDDVQLKWEWFFWDVRPKEASFGKRQLNKGGYESPKKKSTVSIEGSGADVMVPHIARTGISALTAGQTGKIKLKLKVPSGHDSGGPADPKTVSPNAAAKWNWWCEIQAHDLTFEGLELDNDGYFKVTGGRFIDNGEEVNVPGIDYDVHACFVDKADRDEGLAPHGYIKIFPRHRPKKAKRDKQNVEVDWRFDVFRPNEKRGVNIDDVSAHYKKSGKPKKEVRKDIINDPDNKRKPWEKKKLYTRDEFNVPFLVIHITDGPRFESQLQQLTSGAAIHYLVCLNGHVVKIVEDSMGCFHAGWKDKAIWRDFVWDERKVDCNRTSIGIEHLGAAGVVWPDAEVKGSVRIAKMICAEHSISPCNVIRHRDLGGSQGGVHVHGKECPGTEAPWWAYQEAGVSLWPLGTRPGETAPNIPAGDTFFHGIFDLVTFMDDKLTDAANTPANLEKQKDAIKDLKGFLKDIGYWVTKKNGSNAESYDTAAEHCVEMCQERFMVAPSKEKGDATLMPAALGKVDRKTAEVIFAVCQHSSGTTSPLGLPVLPPLQKSR